MAQSENPTPTVVPGICKTTANAIQKAVKTNENKPSLSVIPGVCRSTLNKAMFAQPPEKEKEAPVASNIPGVCRTIVRGILKTDK